MALNDWINRQNSIDSNTSTLEQLFDQAILAAQKKCAESTAKSLYDEICKKIAQILTTSPVAEGDIPIPERTQSWDVEQNLRDIVVSRIPNIGERTPLFQLAKKKFDESPFIRHDYGGDSSYYENVLEILSHKYTKNYDNCMSSDTYEKGAIWHEFWDSLTKLANADGVQLIYHIDVQEIDQKTKERHHSHYVDFGQYVVAVKTSNLIWKRYYHTTPVVSFRYSK